MIGVIRVVKSALFYCSLTSHTIVDITMAAERGYLQPGDKAPEFKVHIDSNTYAIGMLIQTTKQVNDYFACFRERQLCAKDLL